MEDNSSRTTEHWSEYSRQYAGKNSGIFWWESGPEIQSYINRRISGNTEVDWLQYTLHKYFEDRAAFIRCLSLGCGAGDVERSLASLGGFQQCDACDIAEGSIVKAKEIASVHGIRNINYCVADINRITLEQDAYDAVWVHGAMHHFEALEHVCQQIVKSLKPDGVLILQEYIGPNRFQFPERQKKIANLCLQLLPERYRMFVPQAVTQKLENAPLRMGVRRFVLRIIAKVRDGDLIGAIHRRWAIYRTRATGRVPMKQAVDFPTAHSVIATDPSEAVRSSEIVPVLQQYFEIIEKRDWGGNILQFLLADIAGNFADMAQESRRLVRMLIDIEETLLECGEFESDYAYIVARPLRQS